LTDEFVQHHSDLANQSEFYLDKDLSVNELKQLQTKYPKLYRHIMVLAERHDLYTDAEPTVAEMAAFDVSPDPKVVVKFVTVAISQIAEVADEVLWVKENAAKIRAAITTIKEERLLKLMELEMPRRIHDDLSRIFFRTLSELRKHQQWRQARNTVDITPKPITKL
jgi:hypothetical protein